MYNFDEGIQRKGTNCVKWDVPFITDEVLPMWIADMDFQVAPAITKSLQNAASQAAFGYQFLSEAYYESVMQWMKNRHHYIVDRDSICFVPNVVMGLSLAVQTVSMPGDEILILPPVYGPFYSVIKDNDRVLVTSNMKHENGYYTMDLEDLEHKITPRTKAVMICNPHNPSGRVWTDGELRQFADLCIRHDLFIISDDIHCELVTKDHTYTALASLSEEIANRCITCTSPSKAFNLASIHAANCFIKNKDLRKKFTELAEKTHCAECNAFTEAAVTSAYNESADWLMELNCYIEDNLDYFVDYIHTHLPQLHVQKPEGTYMVWVDCRQLGAGCGNFREFLLQTCKIAVNDGTFFGKDQTGFVRFNLACPRKNIVEALRRLETVIK